MDIETSRRERARRAGSEVRVPEPARPEAQPAPRQSAPLFKLKAVSVEGARTISQERIAELYSPYIGKSVSSPDLEEIARSISELYRAQGYHLSRAIVPPQDIKNDTLHVRVIEGRIADISVKGSSAATAARVLNPVKNEEPARLATLERCLLLLNDTPGYKVSETQIEEIGVATGKFRLIVQVDTWNIHSFLGLDNFGVPAVGRLLSQYSFAWNSAFTQGDAFGLNATTVPDSPRELSFGQLWYDVPLGLDGTRLGLSAGYGEVHPSDERRARGTRTVSEVAEVRISTTPLRTRRSSLWFTASATVQNIKETETTGAVYNDRLRMLGVRADYQVQDGLGGWNYFALGFRQGLNIFGASKSGNTLSSRADASGEFSKIDFAFTRIQKLDEIWSVRFASAGQWASTPLLGSQEFNLGGRTFGLGFDTGLIGGDQGIGALLELRHDRKTSGKYLKEYQLFAFVDAGTVRDLQPGGDWMGSIASAGFGARYSFADEFQLEVGIAFPVRNTEANVGYRDPRIFFSVSKAFKGCLGRPYWQCSKGSS